MSKILNRLKIVLTVLLAFGFALLFTGSSCDKSAQTKTELSEDDKDILRYYQEPTLDMNFEDNKVNVILKSAFDYLEELSFKDIAIVEQVSQIDYIEVYIGYPVTKIEYSKDGKFPLDPVGKSLGDGRVTSNHCFSIILEEHSKEKVIKICKLLEMLDMVLCAEPEFIYYAVDD